MNARTGMNAGLASPVLRDGAPRKLCTDCGVSRMAEPKACGQACQFVAPDYDGLEQAVHGRVRAPDRRDETHFGVHLRMLSARLTPPAPGAQWTGIATEIGRRLLETRAVDAVLTVAPDPSDRWRPRPVIVTEPEGMVACRGMRMGFAPTLALLEPAIAAGHRRLALIGIPCQVYALRALERRLGLERLDVIGTPCSDNTDTERFHGFLRLVARDLGRDPSTIDYLEFRPDYVVEVRFSGGGGATVPFLKLPIAELPADFFPLTCRTCVDYTNALADLTVGYMGGGGARTGDLAQWLIVRNARGERLLELLGDRLTAEAPASAGRRHAAVEGFAGNVARAAGGLPLRRAPRWMRPLIGLMQRRLGPKGLEFARARVEMKAIETVLHLRRAAPRKMRRMIPDHVWRLAAPYGLSPERGERSETPSRAPASTERESGA